MTIKVIVELKAHQGRRDELRAVFESMLAAQGPGLVGFLGSSRYEKLDDPDVLVEIADLGVGREAWEEHMTEAAAGWDVHTAARAAGPAALGRRLESVDLNVADRTRFHGLDCPRTRDGSPGGRRPTDARPRAGVLGSYRSDDLCATPA